MKLRKSVEIPLILYVVFNSWNTTKILPVHRDTPISDMLCPLEYCVPGFSSTDGMCTGKDFSFTHSPKLYLENGTWEAPYLSIHEG